LETEALIEELKRMGLTRYEARCYVHLVMMGSSDPRTIASEARIPYPNAYEALRRLSQSGWVEMIKRRPATYRARNPGVIKEEVEARTTKAFQTLEQLYRQNPAEEAELVYTLRGRDKVLSKVHELLAGTKASVMVAAPTMSLSEGRVLEALEEIRGKNVKIRILSDENALLMLPRRFEVRTGNLVAVDILVDHNKALIALPDFSACGWVDSPQVAGHFAQFLELMWSASKPA
jgi:HTH-type transcriptional regulator, sugar sensing transcriptional regulator